MISEKNSQRAKVFRAVQVEMEQQIHLWSLWYRLGHAQQYMRTSQYEFVVELINILSEQQTSVGIMR